MLNDSKIFVFTNNLNFTLYIFNRLKIYSVVSDKNTFDLNKVQQNFILSPKIYIFNLNKLSVSSVKINSSFTRLALKVSVDKKTSILLFLLDLNENNSAIDFKFIGNIYCGLEVDSYEFYKDLVKDQEFLTILWNNKLLSKVLINSDDI